MRKISIFLNFIFIIIVLGSILVGKQHKNEINNQKKLFWCRKFIYPSGAESKFLAQTSKRKVM